MLVWFIGVFRVMDFIFIIYFSFGSMSACIGLRVYGIGFKGKALCRESSGFRVKALCLRVYG
jgi:hypothetical protein